LGALYHYYLDYLLEKFQITFCRAKFNTIWAGYIVDASMTEFKGYYYHIM